MDSSRTTKYAEEDSLFDPEEQMEKDRHGKLLNYVQSRFDASRREIENNKLDKWDRHERSYRMIYDDKDKERESERSTTITPLTFDAVQTTTSEIAEAVFSDGNFYDIEDDDDNGEDVGIIRRELKKELRAGRSFEMATSQALLLGELYGTAGVEVVVESYNKRTASVDPSDPTSVGVQITKEKRVCFKAIPPKNLRAPNMLMPTRDLPWIGVEEYVPREDIESNIASGRYEDKAFDILIGEATGTENTYDFRPDQIDDEPMEGRVLLGRFMGLVPCGLLGDKYKGEHDEHELVEAIVYVANKSVILRAIKNPYMFEDRPLEIYRPRPTAGSFWGISTAEVVAPMQASMDRMIRTHEDALALNSYPMWEYDAEQAPAGLKFELKPGQLFKRNGPGPMFQPLLTNPPTDANLAAATAYNGWAKTASGAAGGDLMSRGGDAKTGAMMLAAAPMLKRSKMAVREFQNGLLIPLVEAAARRYMQFVPDRFPATDLSFRAVGNLGILERTMNQQMYFSMIQTLGPQSPIVPRILGETIKLSTLEDREAIAKEMEKYAQDKMKQDMSNQEKDAGEQIAVRMAAATAAKTEAEARKADAEAIKSAKEAEHVESRIKADIMGHMVKNSSRDVPDETEFAVRSRAVELLMARKSIDEKALDRESNERIAMLQMAGKHAPKDSQ